MAAAEVAAHTFAPSDEEPELALERMSHSWDEWDDYFPLSLVYWLAAQIVADDESEKDNCTACRRPRSACQAVIGGKVRAKKKRRTNDRPRSRQA